jgi:uroporphyrinogen-III synthase
VSCGVTPVGRRRGASRTLKEDMKRRLVAAIGPRTAGELMNRLGVRPVVPEHYNGEALARLLVSRGVRRVLALRRPDAGQDLPRILAENSVLYGEVHVYNVLENPEWLTRVEREEFDIVVASSSQIAEKIANSTPRLRSMPIVSIGPTTTRTLETYKLKPLCTAHLSTLDGVADCLRRVACTRSESSG